MMAIDIIAVGTKMPSWVQEGVAEYAKRMPRELALHWHEISPPRRQNLTPEQSMELEAVAIERHIKPQHWVIALDPQGKNITTETIAQTLAETQMEWMHLALLIGGPDGLAPRLRQLSRLRWAFGHITLPHPLVRVVLAEQLYRAWSINAQHPYHRG
jgi:23S rRNA (pseudouridine1915-N3)-methyltransferase